MSLLGDIFQPKNRSIKQTNVTGKTSVGASASAGERNYRIMNELKSLSPGKAVQGEVVGKNGNTVQIALDADTVLTAKLERDLNIALGQSMSFEVKTNNGSLLSLIPLYSNMANEATIMKALAAAGLPENAENMKMVSDMMEEGLPIDRDSIAYVNRQLVDFPHADTNSIMQMIRLGLPIDEISLEQFEAYKNSAHQILQSVEQIAEELPEVYQELIAEGKDAEAVSFYEQIIKAFTGEETAENGKDAMLNNALQEDGMVQKMPQEEIPAKETAPEQEKAQTTGTGAPEKVAADGIVRDDALPGKEALTPKSWQELGRLLQKLGVDAETARQAGNGELSPKAALTHIGELLSGYSHLIREDFQESVKELLGSKAFQNLLQSQMTEQWTLKPEDVAQKENIERLYERIRQQGAKIGEAFQMADKADTAGARSVQNLQSNVDFMNQLNHLFTYVQLPLKMAGNQAHGDLYVYTNKKSLANNDGNVSALLHLDMEHLGPLDVYVAMQKNQNKVTTNFTVKDEAALDLIAKHIHILDEHLEKRGYSMSANFQLKEDNAQTNIMQEILAQNKNISILSRTSFDMRA
ncbi:MAG: flagellar hook-length control protein FliK [Bacillus sp. (in: Bacteria)]|nr:flagellar hook-length control protein FliK [Bacillus sp. (in: firmicutes)]MCM1427064.1 flagellar hook-length control protein FliK [Eubacterium sp.]